MSVSEDELLGKFIDRYMKKAIDNLIFKLESKYNVELSESSTLEVVLLSSDFINRISQVIKSEQLREPKHLRMNRMTNLEIIDIKNTNKY